MPDLGTSQRSVDASGTPIVLIPRNDRRTAFIVTSDPNAGTDVSVSLDRNTAVTDGVLIASNVYKKMWPLAISKRIHGELANAQWWVVALASVRVTVVESFGD